LRKDPRRRLRDIGEARVAIEDLGSAESAEPRSASRGSWRGTLPWAIAALMTICAGVVGWVNWRTESPAPRSSARLVVSLPPQQRLAIAHATSVELSPDGEWLVYAASSPPGSRPRLYLRKLDRFEAVPIPGTDGAEGPFFSPDSRWMGFFAEGKLFKIAVEGGTPVEICHVGQVVPGASWGPDDSIFFSDSPDSGLLRVSARGGTPERLTTPEYAAGEIGHGWPQLLPDGESVLFSISSIQGPRVAVLSLRTGEWRTLEGGIGGARYLASGHLVYGLSEGLAAVAFDPVAMRTSGAPVVVQKGVYTIPGIKGFGLAAFSVSDTGLLAFLPGGAMSGKNRLVWIDRDGRTRPVSEEPGLYEWPRLSPDGKKLVATNRTADGQIGIWVLDLERDARSRLTLEGGNITPTWSPDGEQIIFASTRRDSGIPHIYRKSADGSGDAHLLLEGKYPRFPSSWTPDGRLLAFTEWHPETMRDIWIFSLDGTGEAKPIVNTRFDEHSPIFSPDGRWVAYMSDESGRVEVYVQSYPAGRGRWIISAGGGKEPAWSADGRALFYRSADKMMEVAIQTEPSFKAGAPRVVFERPLKTGVYDSVSYDVSAGGDRFLMIERDLEAAPNQVNVVLDWDEVLRSRVPIDAN
jgi:serine/threonine-protein kinase